MWFEIQIKNNNHKRSLEVRGTWNRPLVSFTDAGMSLVSQASTCW